ncbi:MAG: metallophosphoesterase [Polyangiaceae bacterium]|nr:metallophosphoesterase [Polyangiaceae bacterium]
MKIRIASDLHFEFQKDNGSELARELAAGEFDVLVIAGDLSSCAGLKEALLSVCEAVAPRSVVYVLGNHEAYGGTWALARERVRRAAKIAKNLVPLEQSIATLHGHRFIGCTLWYPHSGKREPLDQHLGDFSEIGDIRQWLPDTATDSALFLAENVRPGDIVVTHHLPHRRSIAPQFVGSALNAYFLHDVSQTVEQGGAALWIHGHTHSSCDYTAGNTRVVCNPFGYARRSPGEPNPNFRSDFDITV